MIDFSRGRKVALSQVGRLAIEFKRLAHTHARGIKLAYRYAVVSPLEWHYGIIGRCHQRNAGSYNQGQCQGDHK